MTEQTLEPTVAPNVPLRTPSKGSRQKLITFGVPVLTLLIGIGIGGSDSSGTKTPAASAPVPTVTTTAPQGIRTVEVEVPGPTVTVTETVAPVVAVGRSIEDGTWTVGEDIKAGTYKVAEAITDTCYWAITKSGTNGDDIIANANPAGGRPVVTLKRGQDFETTRCGMWARK